METQGALFSLLPSGGVRGGGWEDQKVADTAFLLLCGKQHRSSITSNSHLAAYIPYIPHPCEVFLIYITPIPPTSPLCWMWLMVQLYR
jgi:hypothetical protein